MARRKTTVYLEEDLLRAAKVRAARTGRKDYEVLEEALKTYLGFAALQKVWSKSNLDEQGALDLAYAQLHKARAERSRGA